MQYRVEIRRAAAYGAELGTCRSPVVPNNFVPAKGLHRPPDKRRRISKAKFMTKQSQHKSQQDRPETGVAQLESAASRLERNKTVVATPGTNAKNNESEMQPFSRCAVR